MNHTAEVVLINSPIILRKNKSDNFSQGGDETSYYPLNILYLASSLNRAGITVKIIDPTAQNKTLEDIKREVGKPLVIGISSMTTGLQSALILGKELKGYANFIGIGGIHVTVDSDFNDRHKVFDFAVIGEAENTFVQIVRDIKNGKKPDKLYISDPPQDLDSLPFPARHLIDYSIYKRKEQLKYEVPAAGILASRGCPFNCIFCCIPARGKKVRFRSPKNIVDEMESIYEQCTGRYSFVDDCFTIDRERIKSFCQEIIDRKLACQWIASTRTDRIDEEIGRLLARAGCRELYFGIESGNERVRNKIIGKNIKEKGISKAVEICYKNRILSNLFLMVGFPSETKEDMLDTTRIGNRVKADAIGIHITMPLPGSKIYSYCLQNKIFPFDLIDRFARGELGRGFRGVYPYFVPQGSSERELLSIKKLAYRSFYLSIPFMIRRLRIWLTVKNRFKEDIKLFRIAFGILLRGGSRGQLS